jgi:hypothetical protein
MVFLRTRNEPSDIPKEHGTGWSAGQISAAERRSAPLSRSANSLRNLYVPGTCAEADH